LPSPKIIKTRDGKNGDPAAFHQAIALFSSAAQKWNPLHQRNLVRASQLVAAVIVGIAAYLFSIVISYSHKFFISHFMGHPILVFVVTPLLFFVSTWLVVRFAPEAKGSGIPQVLEAIAEAGNPKKGPYSSPLVSIRTALLKVVSATVGILGGASIGREGPTVQIASSLFTWVAGKSNKYFGATDFRSFLVAGGAAGIAAAFNTPLAGITFALEEIAESNFSQFKRVVMLSVIVGGITAQALGGNYLYFGHPFISEPSLIIIPFAVLIGFAGGGLGGFFSRILTHPRLKFLPQRWWLRALLCGLVCALFSFLSGGDTAGSGYEVTKKFMDNPGGSLPQLFFGEKFLTTVFSYLSGMAGGIFSPSLSIGAGMGFTLAKIFHLVNLRACSLIGMVAFFSGVVQAPLTAVIIIMEMTDQSMLIVPFMIAAFVAHGMGKIIMPMPLYRHLALMEKKNRTGKN
jgi:H+/Cl- antiporter ClcA